ncbi:response regulator transcription factor [Amycolatopsis sp. NPDC049252]|uniref:response regulator transcription factor n=1 Tax=Amycolatopsis sp. NPDC049252 TaxID=3363933 RepID=UPI003720B865
MSLKEAPVISNGWRVTAKFTMTGRETEILDLIGEGLRNHEIARRLVMREATVKTHINNLFAKAGFHSREDAVLYAIGIAEPGRYHRAD